MVIMLILRQLRNKRKFRKGKRKNHPKAVLLIQRSNNRTFKNRKRLLNLQKNLNLRKKLLKKPLKRKSLHEKKTLKKLINRFYSHYELKLNKKNYNL